MKKQYAAVLMAAVMASAGSLTAWAGTWEQSGADWKYMQDDGTYATNGWQWLDGNNDGVAECYYFDGNGYMLSSTTTPDGYQVNADGAWVSGGTVQTQGTAVNNNSGSVSTNGVNHSTNYDPAHPLASVMDQWNLRLTPETNFTNFYYICDNDNVHAMLTGQMEYYHERTGWLEYLNEEEQALYQWFCNWLNGMDFEHMTEMERAQEVAKVLLEGNNYDNSNEDRNMYYAVLIDKISYCTESAMTACTLAKALGLKAATMGTGGNHALYYIQVDGVAYQGSNGGLDLYRPSDYQPVIWLTE